MVRLAAQAHLSRFAVHALVAIPLALLPPSISPAQAAGPASLMAPPEWVKTENGVMLQRQTDENTKLPDGDKAAKRVYEQGLELAKRGADEEEQQKDDVKLRNAEDKFTVLAEEMAPNFAYAYTNRANVRVARGNFVGAIEDYSRAIELAPLAKDTWVTLLNRGSTLLEMRRPELALTDLKKAVQLSNGDRFTLLGRGAAYHTLGQYDFAVADFGAVLDKYPGNVEPWWLRYSLDLAEIGRRQDGLGFARRLAAKFDIEPETTLAVCTLLWKDGGDVDHDEALRRWSNAPLITKRQMLAFDVSKRLWPPGAASASKVFLSAVPRPPPEVDAAATAAATGAPPAPAPSGPAELAATPPSPMATTTAAPTPPPAQSTMPPPAASAESVAALRAKLEALRAEQAAAAAAQ